MTVNHQKSAPNILKQATLVGPHAKDSTLNLNFSLKMKHTNQANAVVQFLKAHRIKVVGISPNGTVIHTQATTELYEHALGVRINDYRLKGQTFMASPDVPKLPAAVAKYVNGIFQTVPVHQVSGHFSPSNLKAGGKPGATGPAIAPALVLAPSQGSSAWGAIADYPIPVVDNCMATDPVSGKVYSFTGVSNGIITASDYVYDPTTDSWSPIADFPTTGSAGGGLEKPVCGAINGKVYVTDGDTTDFTPNLTLYIYDPGTDSFSTGAAFPSTLGMEFGAAGAVLNGEFYVIGGCPGSNCSTFSQEVWAYDPGSDTWSAAADYPIPNAWQGCGGTQGVVICDGGFTTGSVATAAGYKYDPGSDSWSAIADASYANWGMAAIATADGQLLFQDGIDNTGATVNTGQVYDLGSDSWSALPNSLSADYRQAGACGFYITGGNPFTGATLAEGLPGYNVCAVTGPTGTVSGTVTDASTGDPISGAKLTFSPSTYSTSTGSDGTYSITLPVGDYTETASAFGYIPQSASVSVTDGGNTVQDFALEEAPHVTLGGKVTDSGHGYPLYAEVVATSGSATVADVWTNPQNGFYGMSLPAGSHITLTVTPYFSGYTPGTASGVLTSDTKKNFSLEPDASCGAPGYAYNFGEDFNEGTFPPEGWTVTNDDGGNVVWQLSSQDTANDGNFTGGTGDAAVADSNESNQSGDPYDTSLITPPIDTAVVGDSPTVNFLENYVDIGDDDTFDLDISTDGGQTWTTVLSQTESCGGGVYVLPGCSKAADLSSYLGGATSFQLRWRYYNLTGGWDWYAQIDDVQIGTCNPIPGGLVQGQVSDRNTGELLDGATVTDENGNSATMQTVDGQDGYVLFEAAGDHTLTASKSNYQDKVKSVSVGDGSIQNVAFVLNAGQLVVKPTQATLDVPVDTQQSYTLRIGNSGHQVPVDWQVSSLNAPPPAVQQHGHHANVPLRLVPGHYSPTNLKTLAKQGREANASRPSAPVLAPNQGTSSWQAIADYPLPILDSCAVTDGSTGKVYEFTGISNGVITAADYAYDPTTDSWSSIADFPNGGLEKPACAIINGKVYVTNGDTTSFTPNTELDIYDIATDSWSTGAEFPGSGTEFGSAGVALNGEFYVIGGCDGASCTTFSSAVEVYDPGTDSWSSAADYPDGTAWQGCGAAGANIVCAGGFTPAGSDTTAGYKYDPGTDSWSPIADLLYDNWGMAAIGTADGHLLFSTGVTDGTATTTNQGQIYDVASDSWTMLPNNPVVTYRASGACGFYVIGGMDANNGFVGITSADLLPGYDVCGVGAVPWLSFSPTSGTLEPGTIVPVTATIDGTGQTAGTSTTVQVRVSGNTPYGAITIPLTVNWTSGG